MKLHRLYEDHENQFPIELLNMTIGEMLDKAEDLDTTGDAEYEVIENALKKTFAPEFLNRVDDVMVFNALDKEDIFKIIDIELVKLFDRISDLGYKLTLSKSAKDYIATKGFDKQYGARPLKRAIQKYIEDALAEEIINSKLKEGDSIKMDLNKKTDTLTINIIKQKKKTES